ncbi:MAG: hypothetical protein JNL92_02025 [Opitutaceae bacterium]|nr:hypothetical protein [Opitutaceae bacterium]
MVREVVVMLTRGEKGCWFAAALGAVLAAAPFLALESFGQGRYALVLIGITTALTALMVIPYFRNRARVVADLDTDDRLLARWTVPEANWQAWVEADDQVERRLKWKLFFVVLGFSVVIGGGFALADPEAGPVVLAVLLGLCAIIVVIILVTTRRQKRRRLAGPREVRIGCDGLRLGGELHVWNGFGARLESVELHEGPPLGLEFVYSTRAKNQRQINSVRVPVPSGEDARAAHVVAHLRGRMGT